MNWALDVLGKSGAGWNPDWLVSSPNNSGSDAPGWNWEANRGGSRGAKKRGVRELAIITHNVLAITSNVLESVVMETKNKDITKITHRASVRVYADGKPELEELVPVMLLVNNDGGISAELCDALYGLQERGDEYASDSVIRRLSDGELSGSILTSVGQMFFHVQFENGLI